jgi:glucose/mannose transport system permease protein
MPPTPFADRALSNAAMPASQFDDGLVQHPDQNRAPRPGARRRLGAAAIDQGAKLVAVLTLAIAVLYVVGFTLWTTWISFTDSTLLPQYAFVGFKHYARLLQTRIWQVAYANLLVYGIGFMVFASLTGLLLAILIDQKIRAENLLRTIYLYPMALSFVVTGTVWAWLLNPGIGIQGFVRGLGWTAFRFDWLVDREMAIYTVVIAAVWQASGFAMALFLAGLRSLDADLYKAAQIDGAGPARMYLRILVPAMWPIVIAVVVILLQFAIKTYELVRALTAGGPGIATTLPTTVVYDYMFQRGLMGAGSAAAVMLLLSLLIFIVPYAVYQQLSARRRIRHG